MSDFRAVSACQPMTGDVKEERNPGCLDGGKIFSKEEDLEMGKRLGANISADLLEQSGNPKSFIKRNKRN